MITSLFEDFQACLDQTEEVRSFLVKPEGVEEFDSGLVVKWTALVIETVQDFDCLSELCNPDIPDLKSRERARNKSEGLIGQVDRMGLSHGAGVIQRYENLVLASARFRTTQPDFVFSVLARDVRDDLLHVQTFPGAVVAFETGGLGGFEDRSELFT